jgi:hypothetical protein
MDPEPVSDAVIMACTMIELHGADAQDVAERTVGKAHALGLDQIAADWVEVVELIRTIRAAE